MGCKQSLAENSEDKSKQVQELKDRVKELMRAQSESDSKIAELEANLEVEQEQSKEYMHAWKGQLQHYKEPVIRMQTTKSTTKLCKDFIKS